MARRFTSGKIDRPRVIRPSRRTRLLLVGFSAAVFGSVPQMTFAAGPPPGGATTTCAQMVPGLQRCVTDAARAAFRDRDLTALAGVAAQLRSGIAKDSGPTHYYRTYWLAYADFMGGRLAITLKRPEQAKAMALEADRLLDGLANKDQEIYALQSLVVLLQYPVSTRDDMGRLIGRSTETRAKLGNATSVRALYARAQADYFTPKEYGGGQQAEKLLRQALAAPPEPASPLKPTWGRDDCAALLIRILKASGRAPEAQSLYNRWHALMPDSIALGQLTGMS